MKKRDVILKELSRIATLMFGHGEGSAYFDAVVSERIDSYAEIEKVLATIEGKLFADSYDFRNPRVQFSDDMSMGVLTYQLYAKNYSDRHGVQLHRGIS